MRPTWHFVTPADIRWLLALTAPRVHAVSAAMYRKLGLDHATFKRCHKVLSKALRDGQTLTREELKTALQKAGIAVDSGQCLAYIVMHAELEALICSGPRRGKQFTYALLEERVPPVAAVKRDEALTVLTRRYFAGHGPATAQDLAKWSGLTTADAKRGLDMVGVQLQHEKLNGEEYWFSPTAVPDEFTPATAYLLSIYDEYLIGYKDRSLIAGPEIAAKLFTMGNALTAVVQPTTAQRRAIATAARRYGEFLQKSVVMT
jgi:hypothetical protein